MPISFEGFCVGCAYDRPALAEIWGYKSWAAIAKGVVTPAGQPVIVLFITKEKQGTLPQYQDTFDGEVLRMEGEDGHGSDERLINADRNGDEVHLFYRDRHHAPFIYEGRVVLEEYQRLTGKPSRFVFRRWTHR